MEFTLESYFLKYKRRTFEGILLEDGYDYRTYLIPTGYSANHGSLVKLLLARILEQMNPEKIGGCGHDYDCCGCLCGRSVTLIEIKGKLYAKLDESFNY
jgi:hypothetical protein